MAVSCKVKKVVADTGYDTHEIFRYLGKVGIKPVIEVRWKSAITGDRVRDEEMEGEELVWQAMASRKFFYI